MNLSTISDMLRDDPSIKDDVPAFIDRMNAKEIKRVIKVSRIVEEGVEMVSMADLCGGEATERDVKDALSLLASQPLLEETKKRYEEMEAAIKSGEVKDAAEAIAKFGEEKVK